MGRKVRPIAERFWEKVDKSGDCWMWTGFKNRHGYGQIRIGSRRDGTRKMEKAHRVSWALTNGPIPDEMCVCHHCDVTSCVRPGHLFLGTQQDNMSDMMAKGRVHGPRNPVDEEVAIKLYFDGSSTCDLATRFGVGHSTIMRLLKRSGCKIRTRSEANTLRHQKSTAEERRSGLSAARAVIAAMTTEERKVMKSAATAARRVQLDAMTADERRTLTAPACKALREKRSKMAKK